MKSFSGKIFTALLLFASLSTIWTSLAQPSGRESLNKGWSFTLEGNDEKMVDLPHDWGVEGPFGQVYPGETGKLAWWGKAQYKKNITASPEDIKGAVRFFLDIDGAMSYASVYCNGQLAGEWPYGYASFRIDLTPFIKEGANEVRITLDNPENSSRWYPGGGLYRNVWLTKSHAVGIGHWGTWIRTGELTDAKATVKMSTTLRNDLASESLSATLGTRIFLDGKEVASDSMALATVTDGEVVTRSLDIPEPALWSPDTPILYTAVTTLTTSDGKTDTITTPFGIRSIEFRPDGFYLNGRKTFMKGVCLHHDAGALGAAWNTTAWIRRLAMLKDMGCNAIRTSHNPPAPELLDLCDRMGFFVMDELTDTWTVPKKPNGYARLFEEWARKDLTALIHRDRNHPSVILWSIGNEVGEQGYKDKWHIGQELTDLCHREDSTRLTTAGNDNLWAASQPYHEVIDVYGFNYKPHAYAKFHADYPTQPYLGSETASCISTRGFYVFPVEKDKSGGVANNQVSSYDLYAPGWASSPDYEWGFEDENPECAGEFVWTGFDYIGEPTPYNFDYSVLTNFHDPTQKAKAEEELAKLSQTPPPSRSSYFGIIDLAGFPKDRFFLYQARWRKDVPMAHILPHWNWEGREGEVTPVHVYTTGDSAELFVNGKSMGRKELGPGQYRLVWDDVTYAPGEISVKAYKDGKPWAQDSRKTAGPAKKMTLTLEDGHGPDIPGIYSPDRSIDVSGTNPSELLVVDIAIRDRKGNIAPLAANKFSVKVSGAGEFLFNDSGDPTSHVPFYNTEFPAFNGLASIGLRSTGDGKIKITIRGEGLGKRVMRIKIKDGKAVRCKVRRW